MRKSPAVLVLKTSLHIFPYCSAFLAVALLASGAEAHSQAAASPGGGQQVQDTRIFYFVRLRWNEIAAGNGYFQVRGHFYGPCLVGVGGPLDRPISSWNLFQVLDVRPGGRGTQVP